MKGGVYENKSKKGSRFVMRYGSITRRFQDRADAEIMLRELRTRDAAGTLDLREYQKQQPLSFENLCDRYLELRRKEGLRSWETLYFRLIHPIRYFGHTPIKSIGYKELQIFILKLDREY